MNEIIHANKQKFIQSILDWIRKESMGNNVVKINKYGKPYAKITVEYEDEKAKDI